MSFESYCNNRRRFGLVNLRLKVLDSSATQSHKIKTIVSGPASGHTADHKDQKGHAGQGFHNFSHGSSLCMRNKIRHGQKPIFLHSTLKRSRVS